MSALDSLPNDFTSAMDFPELSELLDLPSRVFATGSRVIGNGHAIKEKTDFDLCGLFSLEEIEQLISGEWSHGGSCDELGSVEFFVSLRFKRLNLIACVDEEFFDKFRLATDVCRIMAVNDRPTRVKVFQRVLYGDE